MPAEIFSCPSCFDLYKDPRILPCGHTFCFICIDEKEECPVCQAAIGDAPLKENFLIKEWLEEGGEIERKSIPVCVNCEKDPGKLWCVSCGMQLCEKCSGEIHSIPAFRAHKVISSNQKPPSFSTCEKHNKPKELYCKTCRELVCMLCVLGSHREHRYDTVSEIAEEERALLLASVESISKYAKILDRETEKLETEKKANMERKDELEKLLARLEEDIQMNEEASASLNKRKDLVSESVNILQNVVAKVEVTDLMEPGAVVDMEKRIKGVTTKLFTVEERKKFDSQGKAAKPKPKKVGTPSLTSPEREKEEAPAKTYEEEESGSDSSPAPTPSTQGALPNGKHTRTNSQDKTPRILQNIVALKSSSQHTSCHRNHTLTTDINQFWLSENGQTTNQFLIYDFGRIRIIHRVQLRFAAFDCCPKDFYIESSPDGRGNWKRTLACQARPGNETTEWQTFEGFSIPTRFIRLFFLNTWDKYSGAHVLVSCVRFWE